MKNILLGLLLIFSFIFVGCEEENQETPIEITMTNDYDSILKVYVNTLHIVSMIDEVEVKKLVLNRGNCKFQAYFDNKSIIKYGEEQRFMVVCRNLKEVEVSTNKGDWTFNF
ncbi:hypothetical protein CBLAS_0548 [Campylobacter blaseri]|uniref:Lipoprotein n=1 Tax=Campylobacter blaseri TaxID=2042961 RepID=A0A2P8R099_9BACT|nr:hypothetical protein [Campylobacter blaseri]PSM51921.1 hypothetical protein CQ405_04975 [Campylobacter blaseri]PSM53705.1 hypothetical protein CRN67_04975 [Campylobacter blaseri]QKF85741.1 hypothetical protein CBLAS_0548 [Campylobacter blaseri]